MNNNFTKAMDFRHACKVFDENKTIADEQMHYILEAGRKSPSSFGMEGWKFLVITKKHLKPSYVHTAGIKYKSRLLHTS